MKKAAKFIFQLCVVGLAGYGVGRFYTDHEEQIRELACPNNLKSADTLGSALTGAAADLATKAHAPTL